MPSKDCPRPARRTTIETLEARQVMAADPLAGLFDQSVVQHSFADEPPVLVHHSDIPAVDQHDAIPDLIHHGENDSDFWLDSENGYQVNDDVEQNLDSAHGLTGLDTVHSNYGFTGIGQTVVVIDSGIAWDHYALGGGLGAGYRVVGGWDFTENDADPYDDGPEGSHGTHVAGIIGSSGDYSGNNVGVAPGVDLVGLRVFNDSGNGSFTAISNALQWVIDNHDAFENPITAVNLSLGTTWNATYAPSWAGFLESKFQQIEALGIFTAVSAGNDFTSYNTPGLSYPAASSYVVPVMSVDDSGSLSYFSQRHSTGIAAPGRFIRSTIPDYAGNNNGQADDWANFSGTSMASPYVAGASAIVRQAMELVGNTNITQDSIYDHMLQTSDTFFDSATSQNYSRLNLSAAIDALIPDDDYGSTAGAAHGLGTLSADSQLNGLISALDDSDYFTFTAGVNGVVTFESTDSHQLDAQWDFGSASATQDGNSWSFNVSAGQTYTVGISTSDGLGYYDMDITVESTFSYTDWSSIVGQQSHSGMSNSGETWYRVVAGQDGYVTAETSFVNSSGNVDIALYNTNMQMVDQSNGTGNSERLDYQANSGDELFLRVTGTNADIDFQLTNMVSVSGTVLSVTGTTGNDSFDFAAGSNHSLTVNGVDYSFDSAAVSVVNINGGAGYDTITLTGTSGNETATLRVDNVTLAGDGYSASATNIESVVVEASAGDDTARLYDTAGDESLVAYSDKVTMTGTGFVHEARGFDRTFTYASDGNDQATFYDTAGNDTYASWSNRAVLLGTGYFNDVRDFDTTIAYASTGTDRANFHDSAGDDDYWAYSDRTIMAGSGYSNEGRNFDSTYAFGSTGTNRAYFYDTAGNDSYSAYSDKAIMQSAGYYNLVNDFSSTTAYSTTGIDKAFFYDSAGDDLYTGWEDRATMAGTGFSNEANDFGYTFAQSTSGNDQAIFHGSESNDTFAAWNNRMVLSGSGFFHDVRSFGAVLAHANGGYDRAYLYGTSGDDTYTSWGYAVELRGSGYANEARNFEYTVAFGYAGNDSATFYDTVGNDIYAAWDWRAVMLGSGYFNDTRDFNTTVAHATDGNDRAIFHDTTGDDEVHALSWGAYITNTGGTYQNEARGFDRVEAYRDFTGDDDATIGSIDYIFKLVGDWSVI